MIVQYNTPEFDHNFGPYPYEMGSNPEEVTDEASKMDILDPKNPVFLWPNQITSRDFEGWVEERGSKFLKSWDSHYEALLSTAGRRPGAAKGRPAIRQVWKRRLYLQRLRVLSPVARRRPGSFPHLRKLDQPSQKSELEVTHPDIWKLRSCRCTSFQACEQLRFFLANRRDITILPPAWTIG